MSDTPREEVIHVEDNRTPSERLASAIAADNPKLARKRDIERTAYERGVREGKESALRGAGDTPAPPTPEERAEFKRGELRAAADLMHASAHRDDPVRGNTPAQEPLREALARGLADALNKDWPGDTGLGAAPAIADYLLARPDLRAALAGVPVEPPATPGLREALEHAKSVLDYALNHHGNISDASLLINALSHVDAALSGPPATPEPPR